MEKEINIEKPVPPPLRTIKEDYSMIIYLPIIFLLGIICTFLFNLR